MKNILFLSFVLISCLGFSQEEEKQKNDSPLFLTTGNTGNFETIYNRLNAISENINETTIIIRDLDEIRQGQVIISTNNFGKSFESINIDPRPSLNIEAQRIMYTGNNLNPFQRSPIIIRQ